MRKYIFMAQCPDTFSLGSKDYFPWLLLVLMALVIDLLISLFPYNFSCPVCLLIIYISLSLLQIQINEHLNGFLDVLQNIRGSGNWNKREKKKIKFEVRV